MADVTDLLKQVVIFKDLDSDELALVAEVCKEEKFVSGEYIFHEGEHGNRLYLIVEGAGSLRYVASPLATSTVPRAKAPIRRTGSSPSRMRTLPSRVARSTSG